MNYLKVTCDVRIKIRNIIHYIIVIRRKWRFKIRVKNGPSVTVYCLHMLYLYTLYTYIIIFCIIRTLRYQWLIDHIYFMNKMYKRYRDIDIEYLEHIF